MDNAAGNQYLMQDETFEWDDVKAASNWRDHHATFSSARSAFKDPLAVEWIDDGQDAHEVRFAMVAWWKIA